MAPHEHAEDFVASYTKLMQGDTDIGNFQKVLHMKVRSPLDKGALTNYITQVGGGGSEDACNL